MGNSTFSPHPFSPNKLTENDQQYQAPRTLVRKYANNVSCDQKYTQTVNYTSENKSAPTYFAGQVEIYRSCNAGNFKGLKLLSTLLQTEWFGKEYDMFIKKFKSDTVFFYIIGKNSVERNSLTDSLAFILVTNREGTKGIGVVRCNVPKHNNEVENILNYKDEKFFSISEDNTHGYDWLQSDVAKLCENIIFDF